MVWQAPPQHTRPRWRRLRRASDLLAGLLVVLAIAGLVILGWMGIVHWLNTQGW